MRRLARSLALLVSAFVLGGCLHVLPFWAHPLSRACPGELAPVTTLPRDLELQASYRRVGADGSEEALLLVAERQDDEMVLVGLSAVGVHVFTVVQRGTEGRVLEHVRPLYPHPPGDVLADVHRAWRRGIVPGEVLELATPDCDYRAQLLLY